MRAAGSLNARVAASHGPLTRRMSDEVNEENEEWRLLDALHDALSEALWEQARAAGRSHNIRCHGIERAPEPRLGPSRQHWHLDRLPAPECRAIPLSLRRLNCAYAVRLPTCLVSRRRSGNVPRRTLYYG